MLNKNRFVGFNKSGINVVIISGIGYISRIKC